MLYRQDSALALGIFIVLVFLVLLAVLVPPIAFTKEVHKYFRKSQGFGGFLVLVLAIAASLIPLAINLRYLWLITDDLLSLTFNPDAKLAVALLASWTAIWGRTAMRRLRRRRYRTSW